MLWSHYIKILVIVALLWSRSGALPRNIRWEHISRLGELLEEAQSGRVGAIDLVQGEIAFTKLGETSYRTEFITVSLHEQWEELVWSAAALLENINLVERSDCNSGHAFMKSAKIKTTKAMDKVMWLEQLTQQWETNPLARKARNILTDIVGSIADEIPFGRIALWGVKQIVGSAFGWWTTSEVDKARTKAEKNGLVIKHLQGRVGYVEQRVQAAELVISQLVTSAEDLDKVQKCTLVIGAAYTIATDLLDRTARIETMVEAALDGRISPKALEGRDVSHLKKMIETIAYKRDLQLPINSLAQFLQCPTSFIATKTSLDLLVHVPAAPADSLLEIFRYVPLPIPMENNITATPRPRNLILAIAHDNSVFADMNEADLLECNHLGHFFYCPSLNVVRKPKEVGNEWEQVDDGLCLYSLFTHNMRAALRTCPLTLTQEPDTVRQISKGTFIVVTNDDEYGTINCVDEERQEFQLFKGVPKNVTLGPGCEAITQSHRFAHPENGRSDSWEATKVFPVPRGDIPDILNSTSIQELQEAARNWAGIRQDLTLQEAISAKASLEVTHSRGITKMVMFTFGVSTIASILLLVAIVAVKVWQTKRNKRQPTSEIEMQTNTAPSAQALETIPTAPPQYSTQGKMTYAGLSAQMDNLREAHRGLHTN